MGERYILALDQGTTSSRAILFNRDGEIVAVDQRELGQIYPQPGWVEHDPEEIWQTVAATARAALAGAGGGAGRVEPRQVAAIGITNQRETTLVWERASGRPLANAIVWQCRRSTGLCRELEEAGHGPLFRRKTGLLLDPYFSGTKVRWLLDNVAGLAERARRGEVCFGTVDSWLIYRLTGRHLTDPSNASRTLLYNIHTGRWDEELLEILQIPPAVLPQVLPSCGEFGRTRAELFGAEIPVAGVAGDQQAALFGQTCFEPGEVKNTYGTGCFALIHTGSQPAASAQGLLTTVAWDLGGGLEYALEGSVFTAGAVVQWLRDRLQILSTAAESETLARSVPDAGGVYFVPAFVGLGAPYWDPQVRGTLVGLTGGSGRGEIVRAALESIAFQSLDLIDALQAASGRRIRLLRADGGATANSLLMQLQADLLGLPVVLPRTAESTALGAAFLAGLSSGFWSGRDELRGTWRIRRRYEPDLPAEERERRIAGWRRAVEAARSFHP
jgi:glycerol kinase